MEISGIGVVSALLAGIISFLSPCVLPLVPGYVSFMANQSLDDVERHIFSRERLAIFGISLCFVLGFGLVFVMLGAGATVMGNALAEYRYEANIVGGIVIIIFGLFMTGLLRMNWLQREFRFHGSQLKAGRAASAFLLGLAFAFGWTPCIGPILGAILTVSATSSGAGVALLAIYSVGLGIPFILAALFTDWFLHHLRKVRRAGPWLHRIAGILLIAMGIAMITGYLSVFAFWLLEVMPWLGSIG